MGKTQFLSEPFVLAEMKCSLRGFPSLSLWYGPKGGEDLAVNSIIVET